MSMPDITEDVEEEPDEVVDEAENDEVELEDGKGLTSCTNSSDGTKSSPSTPNELASIVIWNKGYSFRLLALANADECLQR